VIDALSDGVFSRGDRRLFAPLIGSLLDRDVYMLLADFESYVECQARVGQAHEDADRWSRMSILNTARSGKFSSDRSIREYARDIWRVNSSPASLTAGRGH
jgi:starch phosphorylase